MSKKEGNNLSNQLQQIHAEQTLKQAGIKVALTVCGKNYNFQAQKDNQMLAMVWLQIISNSTVDKPNSTHL